MLLPIFIMQINPEGYNKIIKANAEITAKVNEYIEKQEKGVVNYNEFSINKYDYAAAGLQGTYDDFYEYICPPEVTLIVSPNEEKIKGFCGWINRLTNY